MRIDSPVMTNANVTGSFSGSFTGVGNFVGLTADSVEYANVLNKPTLISSSAQITITESQISDLSHYTDTDVKTKLNSDAVVSGSATNVRSFLNVEDGADVTDTANVTAAGALMDSEVTNLAQVKAFDSSDYATAAQGTTADNALPKAGGQMTGNITFSGTQTVDGRDLSVDGAKLDNIEANADVTDTANVTAAGALMDSEVDADIKTLSLPANTTISSFAKTFLDDADAAAVRATIGAEASGADNSTDVTLVTTSHDYLSLSGQAITLGQIDISDDTNLAVSDTTGQTGINLTLSGDTLSGVVSGLDTTSNVQFNNLTVSGDLTVSGTTTSINSTDLNVTDKLISINRGGSTAASADGGGLFISGANESLTWDNGNSRFNFSDDVHAAGNITLTGTVDGRDVASDGSKLDGIESGATADQTAAEIRSLVESATDSNVFTDADHSKLNGIESGATADQTAAEIRTLVDSATDSNVFTDADHTKLDGIDTGANNYVHPTHPGDDFSIDTGALTGAVVISDLDINVTTDTLGHVTDANAAVSTRTLTAANLSLGTSDDVQFDSLGIGTAAPGTTGVIRATNDIVAYYSSDERLKDNISEIPNALEKVESLRGVEFDWNDNQEVYGGHDIGVIAQDVEAVLPEIVETRDNGYKAVKYEKLTAVLIQAVKELSAKVKELENK